MPILVEEVCKKIVKSFPNWLNRHATAYKEYSWPSRQHCISNYIELKWGHFLFMLIQAISSLPMDSNTTIGPSALLNYLRLVLVGIFSEWCGRLK